MTRPETIAICYDFDGTLIEGNMQENSFIPALEDETPSSFWEKVNRHAREHEMDEVLAYMHVMLSRARDIENPVKVTKEALNEHGKDLKFFPGVENWFDMITEYGMTKGVKIEHYVISSGLYEMIKGSKIQGKFRYIFASGFVYNNNDAPEFAARSINYTTKTQYLFRINKGVINNYDNEKVNKFTPIERRDVPFPNMIYIGDGVSDVPTMKMLNSQGGYSIAVYNPQDPMQPDNLDERAAKARCLVYHNRAHYAAVADYSKDGQLDKIITALVDRISGEIATSMNLNATLPNSIPNPEGNEHNDHTCNETKHSTT